MFIFLTNACKTLEFLYEQVMFIEYQHSYSITPEFRQKAVSL